MPLYNPSAGLTAAGITALAAASALDGTEQFPAAVGSATKKVTAAQVAALANTLVAPTVVSANKTLTSADYGVIQYVNTAAVVITFPSAPASTQVIDAYNGSAGNITVNGQTVNAGKRITYISVSSAWVRFEPQLSSSGGGGGVMQAGYISGNWYSAHPGNSAGTGDAYLANRLFFMPFMVSKAVTLSEVGCVCNTAVAATKAQIAIYAGNQSTFRPTGTPLTNTDATTIDTATTGAKSQDVANVDLVPGPVYFYGSWSNGAPAFEASITGVSIATGMIGGSTLASVAQSSNQQVYQLYYTGGTFGTLPDMTSNSTVESAGRSMELFWRAA